MFAVKEGEFSLMTKQQLCAIIFAQASMIRNKPSDQTIMQQMSELAHELTFASGAVLELCEGNEMVYAAATGSAANLLGLRLSSETSLSGLCVKAKELLYCRDAQTDDRVDKEACKRVGLCSMLVVPLSRDEKVIGVLKVFSPKRDAFDDVDGQILKLAALVIAKSITVSLQ
jgi:L-methionine (R)-S-oxide reductase